MKRNTKFELHLLSVIVIITATPVNFSSFIERRQVFYKPIEIVALDRRQLDVIIRVIASSEHDGIVVRDSAAVTRHFKLKRLTVDI